MVKQESKMNSRNVENAMFFLSKFSGVQKAKFKPVDKNDLEKGWNVHINGGKVTFRISAVDKPEDICLEYLLASKHFDPYDMVVHKCLNKELYLNGGSLKPSKEEMKKWVANIREEWDLFKSVEESCNLFVSLEMRENGNG